MNGKVVKVMVSTLAHHEGLPLPRYESEQAAGLDLRSAAQTTIELEPGDRMAIPTGLRVAIPEGYEAQIRPRSGLAIRQGIGMINAPGTIDADYRGEIMVLLINHGRQTVPIKRGMRIAQMIVAPIGRVLWQAVENLPDSKRGPGGFGHTGLG